MSLKSVFSTQLSVLSFGEEEKKNWPWNSWSFYAKGEAGLIGIDVVPE
jgi:hypothetical protein